MKPTPDIPQRRIESNEDELLDQLWQQLHAAKMCTDVSQADYNDLLQRIARHKRRQRHKLAATLSGVAAVLLACIWMLRPASTPPASGAIAQLREMGVVTSDAQVTLRAGNTLVIPLDHDACIECRETEQVDLHTSEGKRCTLPPESMLVLEVPAGQRFHMTLSDGTEVWLNASSVLEYPASFEGHEERRVKLSGEAFFDVSRNEQCPFYVETGQESIRVLGTAFNVNAYPLNDMHCTTLVNGKVSYRSQGADKDIVLAPNQQVRLNRADGQTSLTEVRATDFIAWRNGQIYFEDEKLPDLARRLSRLYGIKIEVDPSLAHYAFSGRLGFDRGVDYITRLITETTDICCTIHHGVIQLKRQ